MTGTTSAGPPPVRYLETMQRRASSAPQGQSGMPNRGLDWILFGALGRKPVLSLGFD